MFCVLRLADKPPVRLEVVRDGEGWRLWDARMGLNLPSTQNLGSLFAEMVSNLGEETPVEAVLSVGTEVQTLTITRFGPLPSDFLVEDEDGLVYEALESPIEVVLSEGQMQAIAEFLDKPVRTRPSS